MYVLFRDLFIFISRSSSTGIGFYSIFEFHFSSQEIQSKSDANVSR